MKVMIATDGSEASVEAARRATSLLHPDAQLELVTIVPARFDPELDAGGFEGPVMTEKEADEEYIEGQHEGHDALVRTQKALGRPVASQRMVPSEGSVADALVALVEAGRPDLLVLGSDQPGWFDRLLHGSVDDALLHLAPCPLLIVNHRKR
jgi:nucleotide-binding universal stress UspA family protein